MTNRTQFTRARARSAGKLASWVAAAALLFMPAAPARAEELPEYRLKALFLYNFALYTEWPAQLGSTLNLCVYGPDPFGAEIDTLAGKAVGTRSIVVHRKALDESVANCQIVFIAAPAIGSLHRVLDQVRGIPVLTVSDSAGALRRGVALNLSVALSKVTFEANLPAAREGGLNLSSKLLRLATQVIQ